MKRFVLLALVVAVGYAGYSYFVDVPPASAEDRQLQEIERQLAAASQRLAQAMRAAGGGMDSTADVDAVSMTVVRLERDLSELKPRLRSEASLRKAREVESSLNELRRQVN